jgi:hypothetical protein
MLAGMLRRPTPCFALPEPANAKPLSFSSKNAEKFTTIRSIYFDVAGDQGEPDDGMRKLSELFSADTLEGPAISDISNTSTCTPPSVLPSSEEKALFTSYCASFIAFAARDSLWPVKKMKLANRSLALLDAAVTAAPDSFEVRALRLAVTHHLPFFFDRSKQAAEDLQRLKHHLDECRKTGGKDSRYCKIDQRILTLLDFVG